MPRVSLGGARVPAARSRRRSSTCWRTPARPMRAAPATPTRAARAAPGPGGRLCRYDRRQRDLPVAASADPPTVDPSTLQPPPPPDARCDPTGLYVICHTVIDFSVDAEPVTDLGLPCGTVYFTVTDVRHGLRFYENGLLVRRHVTTPGGALGFASLSATGERPRVELVGHLNWWSTFRVPGDVDSESTTSHGLDVRLKSPDGAIV